VTNGSAEASVGEFMSGAILRRRGRPRRCDSV